ADAEYGGTGSRCRRLVAQPGGKADAPPPGPRDLAHQGELLVLPDDLKQLERPLLALDLRAADVTHIADALARQLLEGLLGHKDLPGFGVGDDAGSDVHGIPEDVGLLRDHRSTVKAGAHPEAFDGDVGAGDRLLQAAV